MSWSAFDSRPFRHLLVLQVTFGLSFSAFLVLPKYLTAHLGAGATEVGLVMGGFALGAAVVAPLVGPASRRLGAGPCLAGASVLMAVGSFLYLAVTSAGALAILARVLQGAAATFIFAGGSVVAAALAPPGRLTSAVALYATAGLITGAVSPAAVEWTLEHHGGVPAFTAAGLLALLSLLPCRALVRAAPDVLGRPRTDEAPRAGAPRGEAWPAAGATIALTGIAVVFGLASGVMFTYHQPLALQRGIHRVSDFLVAFTLTATALRLTGGRLMDRIGSRRLARGSLLAYAAALAGMAALGPGQLAWFGAFFGLAHGTFLPSLMAITLESGADREARVAWMNAGINVGGLGMAALGPLGRRSGFGIAFVAVGALVAISALALGALAPPSNRGRAGAPASAEG